MARFNDEIITDDEKAREIAMKECGMYLQACLSAGELEDLKEDWNEAGGYKAIPWWRFAFDNIKVSYKQGDLGMKKKFKQGDRVYHKKLKQYGTFLGYAWESDEECDVDFDSEDGYKEQKHVSVSWLDLVEKQEGTVE